MSLPPVTVWRTLDPEARAECLTEYRDDPQPVPVDWVDELTFLITGADTPRTLRDLAAHTLGVIPGESADQAIEQLIRAEDPTAREWGVISLGDRPQSPSVSLLIEALSDSVNRVRNNAERSLLQFPEDLLTQAVPRLLELLDDREPLTRSPAARLLGEIGDLRASEPLQRMAETDAVWLGRVWATEALGGLDDPSATETLTDRLKNDEKNRVRAAAATALGRLKPDGVGQLLREALMDETDERVRTAIEEAMTAAGLELE